MRPDAGGRSSHDDPLRVSETALYAAALICRSTTLPSAPTTVAKHVFLSTFCNVSASQTSSNARRPNRANCPTSAPSSACRSLKERLGGLTSAHPCLRFERLPPIASRRDLEIVPAHGLAPRYSIVMPISSIFPRTVCRPANRLRPDAPRWQKLCIGDYSQSADCLSRRA